MDGVLREHGYTEVEKVGEGSFGSALLVERVSDKARSICKMVDLGQTSEKEKECALRESRLLAKLSHPYIVHYRESFTEGRWLCIFMDHCDGGDLLSMIERRQQRRLNFPEAQVLRWFAQALLALRYIHSQHVLHRDVKPDNFFITKGEKGGTLQLGDFGLAKDLASTRDFTRTQAGTPFYMSPELCQGRPYSWGSDIWSMGCVLFEMCALYPAFYGSNFNQIADKICNGKRPVLPISYCKGLNKLCSEMLHRSPEKRPSAEALLQRPVLQESLQSLPQKGEDRMGMMANQIRSDEPAQQPQQPQQAHHLPDCKHVTNRPVNTPVPVWGSSWKPMDIDIPSKDAKETSRSGSRSSSLSRLTPSSQKSQDRALVIEDCLEGAQLPRSPGVSPQSGSFHRCASCPGERIPKRKRMPSPLGHCPSPSRGGTPPPHRGAGAALLPPGSPPGLASHHPGKRRGVSPSPSRTQGIWRPCRPMPARAPASPGDVSTLHTANAHSSKVCRNVGMIILTS